MSNSFSRFGSELKDKARKKNLNRLGFLLRTKMIQRTLFDVLVISLAIFFWSSYSVKSKPIILTHNNEYDDQVRPQLFPNKKRINW